MAVVVLWHRRPLMFSKHTRRHKGKGEGFRIELSRRVLNTPNERFGTERSTREDVLYILLRGWEEGCGVYKADCPSCIPSRLLGILSPYPLHALSRWFPLSFSLIFPLATSLSVSSHPASFSLVVRAPFIAASNIHRIWISCGRYLA